MNVMLLAAGEGTRLRPHTLTLPKPSIPFLNIPLGAYSLGFFGDTPLDKLVVNTFHLPAKIVDTFKSLPHGAKQLIFSHEENEILGNGGGLKKAEKEFRGGGDFVMMNADEVIIPKHSDVLAQAMEDHKKNQAIATLIVMKYPGVGSKFGGVWTKQNEVLGFGKEPWAGSDFGWHYIGTQILNEKIFDYIPAQGASNILYDGMTNAIKAGEKVRIFSIECDWYETGNEKDFLEASEACMKFIFSPQPQGEYLKQVLNRFSPKALQLDSDGHFTGLLTSSSKIAQGAQLDGFVIMAEGTSIPAHCQLKNICVGAGVQIPENSHFENRLILSL